VIERFNFYDVYGYLIPGFVWTLLLLLPFYLVFDPQTISVAELTAVLIVAYVAGHFLGGLARQALPGAKYKIGTTMVYKSVAILSDEYAGKDGLPPGLKAKLARCFKDRYEFDPTEPFDVRGVQQMFYLCRAALSHAKLGAYVEQYQGMSSLTRSLAFGTCVAAIYYVAWVTGAVIRGAVSGTPDITPLLILAITVLGADYFGRALSREDENIQALKLSRLECAATILLLAAIGLTAGYWSPLARRELFALTIGAIILWLASLRFRSAHTSFESYLALGVYRDFVVQATTKSKPTGAADPGTE
jgi:hypothetical protein